MTRFGTRLLLILLMQPLLLGAVALAQPPNIANSVGVCDPRYPQRCIKPAADGSIVVSGIAPPVGTQDSNLKQVNGATVNVGTGAASTGTQRVTTSTDSTIGTFSTILQNALTNINATASVGICVTTAGGAPADVTVLWR